MADIRSGSTHDSAGAGFDPAESSGVLIEELKRKESVDGRRKKQSVKPFERSNLGGAAVRA
jgi:hypothetical protein